MAQPSRLIRDLGAWALNRTLGVISRQQANEQMTVNRESVVITPHPGSPSRIGLAATSPPSPRAPRNKLHFYTESKQNELVAPTLRRISLYSWRARKFTLISLFYQRFTALVLRGNILQLGLLCAVLFPPSAFQLKARCLCLKILSAIC